MATGRKNTWAPARIKRFSDMWLAGVPAQEIADTFGITANTVAFKRQALGLPRRNSKGTGSRAHRKNRPAPPKPPIVLKRPPSDIPWPDKARLMAGR